MSTESTEATQPVSVTSPGHAMAITLYLTMIAIGMLHALGIASHVTIERWLGPVGVFAWEWLHVMSAVVMFAAAMRAITRTDPTLCLMVEACAGFTLGAVMWLYVVSLIYSQGWLEYPVTAGLTAGLAAGCMARVAQVYREVKGLRRAKQQMNVVAPEMLAEATDQDLG